MINLNTYANIFSPNITSTITSTDWFNLIKNGSSQHSDTISEARKYKLLFNSTGNEVIKNEYNKLKNTLPTVTYNGLFTERKSNDNFISGTGLLFIDIDDNKFDIESLEITKIYSYYKSIGGLGYSILVKVDGITPDNFSSTYSYIINDLRISLFIDTNAVKLSQYSILSYDRDIYINDNSFVYSSIESDIITNNSFSPQPLRIEEEEKTYPQGWGENELKPLIYSNIHSFPFNGREYIEDPNRELEFIQCFVPFRKINDGRKRIMLNYIRNVVYLNNGAPFNYILNTAKSVNIRITENPLPDAKIESYVKLIFTQLKNGDLTPKITLRKIIINPAVRKQDKRKVIGEAMSSMYRVKGTHRLYEIIEDWDFYLYGKLSARSVAAHSDMNIKTVEKYWYEVKEYVKGLNAENKAIIKAYNVSKARVIKDVQENNLEQLVEDVDVITLQEQVLIEHPNNIIIDENYINDEDLFFFHPDIF